MKKEYTRRQLEHFCEFILHQIEHGKIFDFRPGNIILEWEKSFKKSDNPAIWIDYWLELWPENIRNNGGKTLKSDRNQTLTRMLKFIKNTKFSKEIIFKATENYLKAKARDGYQYSRAAIYFIEKRGEESELLNECKKIQSQENEYSEEPIYPTNYFI